VAGYADRVTATLEIRPAVDADLPALATVFGDRHFFPDRLRRQRDGLGLLLVAWLDGGPVGDVYLSWDPADDPQVRRFLPNVAQLIHLEVLSRLWRRGIGTAVIRAAEEAARGLGHSRIALCVELDNHDARRLYDRLGYEDWGHGQVVTSWQEPDEHGEPVTCSLDCDVLVKSLLEAR
jgi:GNAT superfamily N-acetyltransferase